jgi:DNA repair photolyase
MPLTKAKGNMYDWVSDLHTHIGGECPHKCSYCYVQNMHYPAVKAKYGGPVRLIEEELKVNYGKGRTIFIGHMNDMWAEEIPYEWIGRILEQCNKYPENTYVFQTKNPARYHRWLEYLPKNRLLGCTIETNDRLISAEQSNAPAPISRVREMLRASVGERVFITIEPILKGDMRVLADWIIEINPEFVNIGADSKGTKLEEPTAAEVLCLIEAIKGAGIEIKQKTNLKRLLED